ncbi:MAG: AraC family ligand binding domain-containing protein, partial [Planctomycetota bacterium]
MPEYDSIVLGDRLQVDYLHGGYAYYRPGEELKPRVLDDWELVLLEHGSVIYVHDGVSHTLEPGDFVFSHPGAR